MEPNNIEKLIQDNFKDRSIEPSSEARERLIMALNTKPKKKKKLWLNYAVAASLVLGLFFVGGKLLFNQGVVEQPIEIGFEKELPEEIQQQKLPDSVDETKAIVLEEPQDSNEELNIKKQSKVVSSPKGIGAKNKIVKQDIQTDEDVKLPTENSTIIIEKDLVKPKETEDLAVVKSPKQFQYITAEQLLESTEDNGGIDLIQNTTQLSDSYLDSHQLLLEMEKELFDEKNKSIFKRAGKEFKRIKEAVANRNYEHNINH
ncbi:hypothetical protein [Winogradskyella sp.]|uniref:hypothetical protein n=1 Tax=Winogradskyella sp. TaxID=1883156 RepID=UPI003AB5CDF8